MTSPISNSPRRSPSPRSPRYKFTIFPPDVYAPISMEYLPRADKSYRFCQFLKDKFESHFGMRCALPTEAGTAFIGDFDEFERLFLIDAEYVVVIVTEKSVLALKKFYPRLLVFVTVRPEWVNRFILVFVGDVALDPSVDLSVLIHQPIIFKDSNWEADLDTWKALHKLLKVEWTPHKEEEPSPTRRGEVLSVIQRTVVETEVQEVRTRRRSSSRNSDNGSLTPGTLSPIPGASRKLLSNSRESTDLHVVSPTAEKPKVVEEMSAGRRSFRDRPEVESTKPLVLQGASPEHTTAPKVIIVRPEDTGATSKPSTSNEKEASEQKIEPRRGAAEKSRPSDLFGSGKLDESKKPREKRSDKKDSWKFATEVRTKKPKEKPIDPGRREQDVDRNGENEDPMATEEEVIGSRVQTLRATPGRKTDPETAHESKLEKAGPEIALGGKTEKESSHESILTSGYSSLESSISTRSINQIQSPPISVKLSPFEAESSTDVSYVTAPETLSLPASRQAPLSPGGAPENHLETPENSDLTSLPSDTAEKQEVEAFQMPKGSEEAATATALGKPLEAISGPHQPGQVVEKTFEEDGRTVNVKVASELSQHPRSGIPVISKSIEIDVEGGDEDEETYFYSTEFDEDFSLPPPPPPTNLSGNDDSVSRLRHNLRLLESAFGGPEEREEEEVKRRKRGLSGSDIQHSSSCITVSSNADDAHHSLSSVPRAARSVENIVGGAGDNSDDPEAFIVTTQMPDKKSTRPWSLTAIPATPDAPPETTFEVDASRGDRLNVTTSKELLTHSVGIIEVREEEEREAAIIDEPKVISGLEVSVPESDNSPVTSRVEFVASGNEAGPASETATVEMEIGGQGKDAIEKVNSGRIRTFGAVSASDECPDEEEVEADKTGSLNSSPIKTESFPRDEREEATNAAKTQPGKVILTARKPENAEANSGKVILTARKAEQRSRSPGKYILTARKGDQDAASPGKVILTARRADQSSATPGKVILTATEVNPNEEAPEKAPIGSVDDPTVGSGVNGTRMTDASDEAPIIASRTAGQNSSKGMHGKERERRNHGNQAARGTSGHFEAEEQTKEDFNVSVETPNGDATGPSSGVVSEVTEKSDHEGVKKITGKDIPKLTVQPATPVISAASSDPPLSNETIKSVEENAPTESLSVMVNSNGYPSECMSATSRPTSGLPTAALAAPKGLGFPAPLPSYPQPPPGKLASQGKSRSSEGSFARTDSRERCLLDDLSYASLTSEEDGLRIMRTEESLDVPVFEDEKEEKRVWTVTSMALRIPRSLMSFSSGMLAGTWLMASNAGIAVGKLVWSSGNSCSDNPNRPIKLTLLLATATALSPLYRQLSLSFFEMLSSFLWPPVEGIIESGVMVLPAELASNAHSIVSGALPQVTMLSIVSPSQLGRLSPTELLLPTKFVFSVASPPR